MSTARHFPLDGCIYKETEAYQDGFCHDELNNAECNYDGGDCCSTVVYTNVCTECKCHDSSITGINTNPDLADSGATLKFEFCMLKSTTQTNFQLETSILGILGAVVAILMKE